MYKSPLTGWKYWFPTRRRSQNGVSPQETHSGRSHENFNEICRCWCHQQHVKKTALWRKNLRFFNFDDVRPTQISYRYKRVRFLTVCLNIIFRKLDLMEGTRPGEQDNTFSSTFIHISLKFLKCWAVTKISHLRTNDLENNNKILLLTWKLVLFSRSPFWIFLSVGRRIESFNSRVKANIILISNNSDNLIIERTSLSER